MSVNNTPASSGRRAAVEKPLTAITTATPPQLRPNANTK
jgi:hypothetical protein